MGLATSQNVAVNPMRHVLGQPKSLVGLRTFTRWIFIPVVQVNLFIFVSFFLSNKAIMPNIFLLLCKQISTKINEKFKACGFFSFLTLMFPLPSANHHLRSSTIPTPNLSLFQPILSLAGNDAIWFLVASMDQPLALLSVFPFPRYQFQSMAARNQWSRTILAFPKNFANISGKKSSIKQFQQMDFWKWICLHQGTTVLGLFSLANIILNLQKPYFRPVLTLKNYINGAMHIVYIIRFCGHGCKKRMWWAKIGKRSQEKIEPVNLLFLKASWQGYPGMKLKLRSPDPRKQFLQS